MGLTGLNAPQSSLEEHLLILQKRGVYVVITGTAIAWRNVHQDTPGWAHISKNILLGLKTKE